MTILQLQLSGKTFICLNKKYEEKTIVYNCILANFMYSATPEFFACLLTPPEKIYLCIVQLVTKNALFLTSSIK